MNLEETIYKRKSVRNYNENNLSEESITKIKEFIDNCKVLNPNIKWKYDIVSSDEIKTIMNWKAPHYIFIYSQEKENYYQNIGFIFQQVDLYLQSKGIGSCWIGAASPKEKEKYADYKYIISIAFGKSDDDIYRDIDNFKRNSMDKISDYNDERLEVARLAPSAMNSQPWYFTHNKDNTYNIYRKKQNFLKRKILANWNKVDVAIALAHLYIANKDTFEFSINEKYEKVDGYIYEGSFKI